MSEHQLLGPETLAEQLGIPVRTLYAWRYRHDGPPAIKVGKHLRYRQADVDAWLDEHRSTRKVS